MDGDADLDDPAYYLNRELSEVAFQRRVLHEAVDDRNPLLERLKFLAIFTQNMDEFFRKRVGGLRQQIEAGVTDETVDGMTPEEQWGAAITEAETLFEQQAETYRQLRSALAAEGVRIEDYTDLTDEERAGLRERFRESIMPTLTPLTFDPAHPFPHISNLSLSLAVLTRRDPDSDTVFSRVKVPENRPRLVQVDEGTRYVLLEDVIGENLDLLFPNVEVVDYSPFRVTRNAEVRRNETITEDLVEQIQEVIRERRFARVVRLEIAPDAPTEVRELLVEQLDLREEEVYDLPGPLDYRDLMSLLELDRPELKRDSWEPKTHPRLPETDDFDLFAAIRRKDILVHHPYHTFEGTVQRFLETAARDPDVLAIKAAIYRTAEDSAVVESLIEASQNGKQVGAMVELKARFDEENNLRWVERLEEEGIHVAYGKLGYKTHTKTALVVREEDDGVRLYSHVGTGNYHSETAKQYEDLGLLTADRSVGQDLVKLFNYFTGHSLHEEYEKLLIAPTNMRGRFAERIRREAENARDGVEAEIVVKANRLEDPDLVRELYKASQAGVDVDLLVRDICRLRPGIDGVSENITVRSVVGRFLEHSRVYRFHAGGDPEYLIGSADWMHRNLDDRVEAVTPVEDDDLRAYLRELLDTLRADNRRTWELQSDGTYVQCHPDDGDVVDAHRRLMALAEAAEPERPDPVAVDLEAPLAPDSEEFDPSTSFQSAFAGPSLDEIIRRSDIESDVAGRDTHSGPDDPDSDGE
jgi:polyphosphate kinase